MTVKEFIDKARAAGHDALGLANDLEFLVLAKQIKEGMHLTGVRVKVDNRLKAPYFGYLVGLMAEDNGDVTAIVRPDGFGMYLVKYHPSCVSPVTPEQEDEYK